MATTIYNEGKVAMANNPFYQTGKKLTTVQARHLVDVSAGAANDIYVLAEGLNLTDRIHRIVAAVASGTLTAANDNNIGFYKKNADGTLTELDQDILIDGADYSGGIAIGTDLLSGLSAADAVKSIGEHLGLGADSDYVGGIVLAMTMVVAATTTDRTLDFDVQIEDATRL